MAPQHIQSMSRKHMEQATALLMFIRTSVRKNSISVFHASVTCHWLRMGVVYLNKALPIA